MSVSGSIVNGMVTPVPGITVPGHCCPHSLPLPPLSRRLLGQRLLHNQLLRRLPGTRAHSHNRHSQCHALPSHTPDDQGPKYNRRFNSGLFPSSKQEQQQQAQQQPSHQDQQSEHGLSQAQLQQLLSAHRVTVLTDSDSLDEAGNPKHVVLPADYQLVEYKVQSEELIDGLDGVDAEHRYPAGVQQQQEVPGTRVIVDTEELELVGEGLPIIHGKEWPEAYLDALEDINSGGAVPVPRPHPKFTLQDLHRISAQGPAFDDLVLEHAERTYSPRDANGDSPAAEAYNYIPFTVLGDYFHEVEPNWLDVPRMTLHEFYYGLKQRNWTSDAYAADAAPWRVQFFQCGHNGPSAWGGWRALVTQQQGGARHWVDMPHPGAFSPVMDPSMAGGSAPLHMPAVAVDLLDIGYNQVFEQVFQAYEQKLPLEGVLDYLQHGAIRSSQYAYNCPGDRLLDISWHVGQNAVGSSWSEFLMRPSMDGAVEAVKWAVDNSGIWEMKQIRDMVSFAYLPPPPQLSLSFEASNAGPLYFLICLTAGVVIPALRRSKILDIKTLEEDMGAASEFAKSKATARKEGLTGVEFADIAGLDPILGEVMEVVEFLKDPKTFSRLGARPPKGILLEGDPGTGKTLLAKALAGEAMVPFYQMSGTEFTEGIVGLGAARVRDLFKRARVSAPCVIFVDELDALGLKRAEGEGQANEEREQTLNQLLTEMDGFTPDTGVVFIGATNRADLLDPALMRPGRFDRKVRMPRPDTEGRYDILRLNLRGKDVSPDVDLLQLARDLPGLVGADLANIVNEAQLNAVRAGRSVITKKDLYAGVDRFTQGEVRQPLPTSNKLPTLCFAAKEVGIALVAALVRRQHGRIEPVERVSIQPKGRSYSRTLFARGPDEDYNMITRGRLLDRIKVAMAGSIAVKVVLGEDTNFAIADIKRAKRMVEKYVFYYGMSDIGITTWAYQPYSSDFRVGQNRPRKVVSVDAMDEYADWPTKNEDFRFDAFDPSDVTWHRYQDEARRVTKECYEEVWNMLEEHRDALWAGVRELSAQKEMLGSELRDVFDAHPPAPLAQRKELGMVLFTRGREDRWPYGMEWLNDAYPLPYWVRKQQEEEEQQQQLAGAR